MSKFNGFSRGKANLTQIPSQFYTDLLPLIDDLAELKVTLFCMWALQQKEGEYRYLRYDEFMEDSALKTSLQVLDNETDVGKILDSALAKTLARGTLLSATIEQDEEKVCYYFINSERGRTAVEQINSGEWRPASNKEIDILPARPTIYALYEQNIGILTPMIVDAIKDAEKEYPSEWLADAVQFAVESNARSWRYISTVLENWNREGRNRETVRGHYQQDDRYITGKWADFIES